MHSFFVSRFMLINYYGLGDCFISSYVNLSLQGELYEFRTYNILNLISIICIVGPINTVGPINAVIGGIKGTS